MGRFFSLRLHPGQTQQNQSLGRRKLQATHYPIIHRKTEEASAETRKRSYARCRDRSRIINAIHSSMISMTDSSATLGLSRTFVSHCFSPVIPIRVFFLRPRSVAHSTLGILFPLAFEERPSSYESSIAVTSNAVAGGTANTSKSPEVTSSPTILFTRIAKETKKESFSANLEVRAEVMSDFGAVHPVVRRMSARPEIITLVAIWNASCESSSGVEGTCARVRARQRPAIACASDHVREYSVK